MQLKGDGSFALDVVGESNYQDNLEAICGPRSPDGEDREIEATLYREENNPYDPGAVRVDIHGRTVGYLRRDVAPRFHQILKSGPVTCTANIRGGWGRGDNVGNYGVWLDVPVNLPGAVAVPRDIPEATTPKKRRRWGRVFLFLIAGLFAAFVACVLFGLLLQALGY